jgi:hypothetical protein
MAVGATATMTAAKIVWVILAVLAVLAVQVALWTALMSWMKARLAQMAEALRERLEASGQRITLGPTAGVYRGGTGTYPRVKGNGVAVLTDERLIFCRVMGTEIEVPLALVTGVREARWFRRAAVPGRLHVILQLLDGQEVGFLLKDHPGWTRALRASIDKGQ